MDFFEEIEKIVINKKMDLYIVASKDIKRMIDSIDAKLVYKIPSFEDESQDAPKHIIIEKTKHGYVELFTRLPIGSAYGNSEVYCELDTLEKIYCDKDLMRCYNGNYDHEYLQLVASSFNDFHKTAQSVNKSIKTKILKSNKKYN